MTKTAAELEAIYAEFEDDYAYYTDEELAETPAQRKARLAKVKPVAKGHCRKCGAHIGRGVAFHEKVCAG